MNNDIVKGSLVCVALNDRAHIQALDSQLHEAPYKQPPTQPVLYFKPRNTFSHEGALVPWPEGKNEFVVGASLGLVIGREACRVSVADALQYLQGVTLVHDFSLPEQSYYRPDIKGKCLDGSAPVGPLVVNSSDMENLQNLRVITEINGEVSRDLAVSDLCRGPAELISTLSYIMTFQPGDVIAIGFPAQRATLQQGDRVVSRLVEGGTAVGDCVLSNTAGEVPA